MLTETVLDISIVQRGIYYHAIPPSLHKIRTLDMASSSVQTASHAPEDSPSFGGGLRTKKKPQTVTVPEATAEVGKEDSSGDKGKQKAVVRHETTGEQSGIGDKLSKSAATKPAYSAAYSVPAANNGTDEAQTVEEEEYKGDDDEVSSMSVDNEDATSRGIILREGQKNALNVFGQTPDISLEDRTLVTAIYRPYLRKFQLLWMNISQEQRNAYLASLRTISQKIRQKFPVRPNESLVTYRGRLSAYDKVDALIAHIEGLIPSVFACNEQLTAQDANRLAPDIINILKIALDLDLDWKVMTTERCGELARQVFHGLPAGLMKDIYSRAFIRAENYQKESADQLDELVDELRSAEDPETRMDICEQLENTTKYMQEQNKANNHHHLDHTVSTETFTPAKSGERPEDSAFEAYFFFRRYMSGEQLSIEETSEIGVRVASMIYEACRGEINPVGRTPASNVLSVHPPPGLLTSTTPPSQETEREHAAVRTDIDDEWDNSGVPGPLSDSNITEFGIVEHVRSCGGRNPGFRVILNVGTENRPLYEVMPGSQFGRGVASSLRRETPEPLVKNRLATHVQKILHAVEVEQLYVRRTRPGELAPRPREPITYFKIVWSAEGRQGDFATSPECEWVTRSQLISFCGRRQVDSWRSQLFYKQDKNKMILDNYKKTRIHPDTKEPLKDKDIRQQPWLIVYERK